MPMLYGENVMVGKAHQASRHIPAGEGIAREIHVPSFVARNLAPLEPASVPHLDRNRERMRIEHGVPLQVVLFRQFLVDEISAIGLKS